MRRAARVLGLLLIVAGIGTCGWAILVWQWQDPFTALYTKWEQGKLSSRLDSMMRDWKPPAAQPQPAPAAAARSDPAGPAPAKGRATKPPAAETVARRLRSEQAALKADGARYRKELHEGDPLGRITVPRLGLKNMVVVNGTDHDSLTKGPGRYLGSYMPGQGQLIYIAGHRTTYLAPFSHIDSLRRGDRVTLQLPYATFTYAVTGSRIVPASDLSVLRTHGHEQLILQACHPRFFATHRYLAYARLVEVRPRSGLAYTVDGTRLAAAPLGGKREPAHAGADRKLALAARH
jgi:sortase A